MFHKIGMSLCMALVVGLFSQAALSANSIPVGVSGLDFDDTSKASKTTTTKTTKKTTTTTTITGD